MRRAAGIFILLFSVILAEAQSKQDKIKAAEVLGDTLMSQQNFAGALSQYNKVIKSTKLKDVESRQILYKRAVCFFYLNDFNKALADLNTFIDDNPNLYRARILRAFVYREMEEPQKQLIDLNEVLEWDPLNTDLLKWRAGLMVETGLYDSAITEFKRIQLYGNDEETELYLGLCYYNLAKPDSALIHFDESIKINGGYVPAYLYAASVHLEEESFEEAKSYIDLGLMLDAQNLQLIFYKGIVLVETGNQDEGCRLLNKAFYGGIDDASDYLVEYCYPKEE